MTLFVQMCRTSFEVKLTSIAALVPLLTDDPMRAAEDCLFDEEGLANDWRKWRSSPKSNSSSHSREIYFSR
jgi:hypothetical protein